MPKYYFTVRAPQGVVNDKKGITLDNEAAAREYAARVVERLKEHEYMAGKQFEVAVKDDAAELFVIPFESQHLH